MFISSSAFPEASTHHANAYTTWLRRHWKGAIFRRQTDEQTTIVHMLFILENISWHGFHLNSHGEQLTYKHLSQTHPVWHQPFCQASTEQKHVLQQRSQREVLHSPEELRTSGRSRLPTQHHIPLVVLKEPTPEGPSRLPLTSRRKSGIYEQRTGFLFGESLFTDTKAEWSITHLRVTLEVLRSDPRETNVLHKRLEVTGFISTYTMLVRSCSQSWIVIDKASRIRTL